MSLLSVLLEESHGRAVSILGGVGAPEGPCLQSRVVGR